MEFTPFAGLTALDENDPITIDGGSFLIANPRITDPLLHIGAVTHRHDAHAALPNPNVGATGHATTGGQLASDSSFAITYTVIDAQGGETLPAPPLLLSTGAQMPTPTIAPSAVPDYTGGIMPAGGYYYALTYTDGLGGETPIGPSVFVYVDPGFASAQVDLSQLDFEISGAQTWRLWRSYEGADWHLVVEGATNTFIDGGFDPPDNPARPPADNSTNQSGELVITLPTALAEPALAAGASIRLYLAPDSGFSNPCLYAAFPIASAGATFTIDVDSVQQGSPPHVSRSIPGAAQINPDTDILDWHWKRPVASYGALPSGSTADVRMTVDTGHLWGVLGASAAGPGDWTDLLTLGSDADVRLVASAGTSSAFSDSEIMFVGSGAARVQLSDLGGGSALVMITVPEAPPAGVPGIEVGASGHVGLLGPETYLEFAASGGASVVLQDMGAGSARVLIGVTGTAGASGAPGIQGIQGPPGAGVGVGASAMTSLVDPASYVEFAASGATSVSVTALGGGSARVMFATPGQLLAITNYVAGANTTTAAVTSASLTAVDATHMTVSFVAPASHHVFVEVSVFGFHTTTTDYGILGLLEGGSVISGCQDQACFFGNVVALRTTVIFEISGISGGSHTYTLAARTPSGGVSVETGPDRGACLMTVRDAG